MDIKIISMPKDVGRKYWTQDIVKKLNATIWDGNDPTQTNNKGIVTHFPNKNICTYQAKLAKKKLFEDFKKNSDARYLFLLEDDIIVHKQFYDYMQLIDKFINDKKPKLLYLGLSNFSQTDTTPDLSINNFSDLNIKHRVTGAYGVIIHRSIIDTLLIRIDDEYLKYKPFDLTCLGYIQKCFPTECYLTNPQLIIPDISSSNIRNNKSQEYVWSYLAINPYDYIIPTQILIFVIVNDDIILTQYFLKLISMFTPLFKIILIYENENQINNFDIETIKLFENIQNTISNWFNSNKHITSYYNLILYSDTSFNWNYMSGKYMMQGIIKCISELKQNIHDISILDISIFSQ
jgi:hypothetical protein